MKFKNAMAAAMIGVIVSLGGALFAADPPVGVNPQAPPKRVEPVVTGVKTAHGVEYAKVGEKSLKLDLYVPQGAGTKPPLLVWIHGGAWKMGDKAHVPLMWLTKRGYAIASINYRFSQEAVFPAQIFDCKAAVRFLRAHAAEYGYDATRIAVGGDSAGGHLAALMGTTNGKKELEGDVGGNAEQSSGVQVVLDYYGPTDFVAFAEFLGKRRLRDNPVAQLLGGEVDKLADKAKAASPARHVTATAPPFLIVQGSKDPLVPQRQAEILHDALKKAGADSTLKIIEGGGHGGRAFYDGEAGKLALDLLEKHLKPTP